jgi:hypothetical protein
MLAMGNEATKVKPVMVGMGSVVLFAGRKNKLREICISSLSLGE